MFSNLPDVAHIVISLDANGLAVLRSYCFGKLDASYGQPKDDVFLAGKVPFLLAELRQQIALGRRLTVAESGACRVQVLSGQTVTE